MTNRVTGAEVKEIIPDSALSDAQVEPFITSANLTITEHLSGSSLSDELLKELERWFSAHLVATYERRRKAEKLGDASDTFDGQTGMGLDFTSYGQQVKILDPTGILAGLGKRKMLLKVV